MSAVDEYLALGLEPDSPLVRRLMDHAQQEAENTRLVLTAKGERGSLAEGLTPAMVEWLGASIAPIRGPALAELEAEAREIKIAPTTDGILLESVQDAEDRRAAERTVEVLDAFNRDNKDLLEDAGRLRDAYTDMRANAGGRDAKVPNKLLEFGLLLPVIMVPEGLLNFESFRRAPIIQSDAMALGATILVGVGLAAAAYCWGLFIRGFTYYSRPDDRTRQHAGWPLYSWGSILFAVSMGSAAAARYYYLMPKIAEAIVTGAPVPNVPFSIGSLLFGNSICFFVGAVITFFLNDPNPEYADMAEKFFAAERKLSGLRKRGVSNQLDQVNARARDEKEAAKRKARQMAGKPGYTELRQRLDRVNAVDSKVIGILQGYRAELVHAIKTKQRAKFEFEMRELSSDRANPMMRVPIDRFLALPLYLARC